MSEGPGSSVPTRRARRIEEAVLEVEGVASVRVWEMGERVEVGVVASPNEPPTDVLRRVLDTIDALRAPDEEWDVGLLNDT